MLKDFTSAIRPAIVLTLLSAVLLGLVYPAALTGIGQLAFPTQANGSLIREGDRVVGSELIAQAFTATTIWPGPATGSSISSRVSVSGPPVAWVRRAFKRLSPLLAQATACPAPASVRNC